MSSKVGHSQPQGRRTPLSLAGGKHGQQQQQQNNKNNTNLNKIQELKSEAAAAAAPAPTKNGNNNAAANKTESNNSNHKEQKKSAQQNGNGNGVEVVVNAAAVKDDVTGGGSAKNGTANGHKNNKNTAAKNEINKEKDNKEIEAKEKEKEKPKKKNEDEKMENDAAEQVTTKPATEKDAKPKETAAATASEKKQTAVAAKSNAQKPATPTKATERGTATPPAKSPASKSSTPSKSPRVAAVANNKSANGLNDPSAEEMPPLLVAEPSPTKKVAEIKPTATSTPGKVSVKRGAKAAEIQKSDTVKETSGGGSSSPIQSAIPRVYSQISGRRSIRPMDEFTPQMYSSQYRESYRRINTELDVTGNTNTSMNVTVGSEVPNNSSFLSFSLFGGRGRKREHTPPPPAKSQSAVELTTATEATTPTKRARLDMHGIFTAMSSPLTLLRTRFSKTTLESSTPAKVKETAVDDDVQNVSGVSIEEVVCNSQNATEIATSAADESQNITVGKEAMSTEENTPNKKATPSKKQVKADAAGGSSDIVESPLKEKDSDAKAAPAVEAAGMDVDSDIQIKETPIIAAVGDPKSKQRGCSIM